MPVGVETCAADGLVIPAVAVFLVFAIRLVVSRRGLTEPLQDVAAGARSAARIAGVRRRKSAPKGRQRGRLACRARHHYLTVRVVKPNLRRLGERVVVASVEVGWGRRDRRRCGAPRADLLSPLPPRQQVVPSRRAGSVELAGSRNNRWAGRAPFSPSGAVGAASLADPLAIPPRLLLQEYGAELAGGGRPAGAGLPLVSRFHLRVRSRATVAVLSSWPCRCSRPDRRGRRSRPSHRYACNRAGRRS